MKKKKGSEKDKENAGCGEKSTRGLVWTEEDEEEERLRKAVYASVSYTHLTLPTTPYV